MNATISKLEQQILSLKEPTQPSMYTFKGARVFLIPMTRVFFKVFLDNGPKGEGIEIGIVDIDLRLFFPKDFPLVDGLSLKECGFPFLKSDLVPDIKKTRPRKPKA